MSSKTQHYLQVGIRYVVAAFLIVALTQILLALNIIGNTFLENVTVTLFSLAIAAALLKVASSPRGK